MIVPLLNLTVKGAVWYQGEANSGDPTGMSLTPDPSEHQLHWLVLPPSRCIATHKLAEFLRLCVHVPRNDC